jgi:ABC-2 type transport system permease protein
MTYNPELKSVFMFVPGVMTVILMLVSAMMTSISITREKELGTMEVILVSPLKPIQVIAGKVIPYVFLSVINAIVIILLSIFVFKMPVQGSLFLLAFESIFVYNYRIGFGYFNINHICNPTNSDDDFINGFNAACDYFIWIYFSN